MQQKAERMFKNMLLDILYDYRRPASYTPCLNDYIATAAKKFTDWCTANADAIKRDEDGLDYYSATSEAFPVLLALSDDSADSLMQNYVFQFLDTNIKTQQ